MDVDDNTLKTSRLVLLALGSQDPRWQKPFATLYRKLAGEMGEASVSLAYLDQASPSLIEVAESAVQDGMSDIFVLPLFLSLDSALEQLIPRQVVKIKERFPTLGVVLLPPIGEHPTVAEAIYTVARASCAI